MAKFASSCLDHMTVTSKILERSLGPGTADLTLRLGLHSGPTIAGVLRGEKARFQLFGDTVSHMTPTRLIGYCDVVFD
jgi:class 3 adenylate cyclase